MSVIRELVDRIRTSGRRRSQVVRTVSMGQTRDFEAFDVGPDTFIFERGIVARLKNRPSVLIVEKSRLGRKSRGRVFTLSSGNHAVAAFPLLDGRFWKLSAVPSECRSAVLSTAILCSNISNDTIETSQRDVSTAELVAHDLWLRETVGLSRSDVVMGERNEATLDYYRKRGEEWRVKPLAWTEQEIRAALFAARKRISSKIHYYHSARGVHLLSFAEFCRFAAFARSDPDAFVAGLRELVGVYEGNETSFTRMPKYRGHHEIEFFGLERGVALETLIPELEKLFNSLSCGCLGQLGVIQQVEEIIKLYRSLLTRPEFATEESQVFLETIYMYVTGELYSVLGEGLAPAFDDRRTALPGATFVEGRLTMHPGADSRSEVLLSNLRGMLSKGEFIEYANVYELREDETTKLGKGWTREVVYKTNFRPVESSLIEKGLSSSRKGYGDYMLARIGALRAMGVSLSKYYRILRRRGAKALRAKDFYIRMRCAGEPMGSIPATYFRSAEDSSVEAKEVVLSLATLMGDAAAQNLAMKKYDPATASPLYGIGKEIYEFEYDLARARVMPQKVSTCSIRGSFGWPCLEQTDENLREIANFYLAHFARTLKAFQRQHTVPIGEIAECFMSGFEHRTRAMAWELSVLRDKFESFHPSLPARYEFGRKWRFTLWALERQERDLPVLRQLFFQKVEVIENEDIRNHS